jgi:hypothetical protein
MNFIKTLLNKLPEKLDFLWVSVVGLWFSFAMSPSRIESLALTSGDDGPIFPAVAVKNIEFFSTTGISSISNQVVLMWTTSTKWIPALAYKFLGINPELFHTLFVYSQITLILVGTFRLSRSFGFSRAVSYSSVLLLIIYESYFINMGAYGGQTWMPYTTWIAIGPLLFSWANVVNNNKFKALTLLAIGTLIHPGMGLSAAILMIVTQNILFPSSDNLRRLKGITLFLGTVATISLFTTLPLRLQQFKPIPAWWQELEVFHWSAWNLTNGQIYFQQSKFAVIFTISIISMATLFKVNLKKIYSLSIAVVSTTILSVLVQAIVYSMNIREISSINLARATIFSSIFLTVIASKILSLLLNNVSDRKIGMISPFLVFSILFPSSASLLISNVVMSFYAYKLEQSKKYFRILTFGTLIISCLYISNLLDVNKDSGKIFMKELNFFMPNTISFRAIQSSFKEFTTILMLAVLLTLIYLGRKNLLKFTSIVLILGLSTMTVLGRYQLSNIRFKNNSNWINTQLWAQNNSNPNDLFIFTGSYNLYGAWTTLTKRIIINADSNAAGGLYLFSKQDKDYELIRRSVRELPVPYYEIEKFEKYVVELADLFDADYLVSSHSDFDYGFPVLYSNAGYTIYRIN